MNFKIWSSICFAAVAMSAHAVYGVRSAAGALSVTESITDLGGGTYKYDYTLNNVAGVDSVWWWGVYSPSAAAWDANSNLASFYAGGTPSDVALAGNPSMGYAFDNNALYDNTYGVTVGSSSTLSFTTDSLQTGGKSFFADITGEWTGSGTLGYDTDGTQVYSYMGNTQAVPEPMSMAVLGLGAAALLRRRRK